jgi:hypothetical protein
VVVTYDVSICGRREYCRRKSSRFGDSYSLVGMVGGVAVAAKVSVNCSIACRALSSSSLVLNTPTDSPERIQLFKHSVYSTCCDDNLTRSHDIVRLAPLNTLSASADIGGIEKIFIARR